MGNTFENSYMYWIGMDIKSDDAEELSTFNKFYNEVHLPEVVAGNGFVAGHRYELLADDARGPRGPRFLAMYEIADSDGVERYLNKPSPGQGPARYTAGPPVWQEKMDVQWRMIWHFLASTGPSIVPDSVFMVGIDAPEGASDADVAEFNDFYTSIHMPEANRNMGYQRAARFELQKELLHPEPHCPQFCAIYEGNAERTAHIVESGPTTRPPSTDGAGGESPSYTKGPVVWQEHTTPWRLAYKRVGP